MIVIVTLRHFWKTLNWTADCYVAVMPFSYPLLCYPTMIPRESACILRTVRQYDVTQMARMAQIVM